MYNDIINKRCAHILDLFCTLLEEISNHPDSKMGEDAHLAWWASQIEKAFLGNGQKEALVWLALADQPISKYFKKYTSNLQALDALTASLKLKSASPKGVVELMNEAKPKRKTKG